MSTEELATKAPEVVEEEKAPVVEEEPKAEEKEAGPSTEEIIELDKRLQKLNDRKAECEKEIADLRNEISYLSRTKPYQKSEEWVAQGNQKLADLANRELAALNDFKRLLDELARLKDETAAEARAARIKNGENLL